MVTRDSGRSERHSVRATPVEIETAPPPFFSSLPAGNAFGRPGGLPFGCVHMFHAKAKRPGGWQPRAYACPLLAVMFIKTPPPTIREFPVSR